MDSRIFKFARHIHDKPQIALDECFFYVCGIGGQAAQQVGLLFRCKRRGQCIAAADV